MRVYHTTHVFMLYIFFHLRAQMAMTKSMSVVGETPVTNASESIILLHFIQV